MIIIFDVFFDVNTIMRMGVNLTKENVACFYETALTESQEFTKTCLQLATGEKMILDISLDDFITILKKLEIAHTLPNDYPTYSEYLMSQTV